jgi:2-succinyl-5-enolpyruvyl-6-hydroxy-3-cyclohexene-1-carboxylate synthase
LLIALDNHPDMDTIVVTDERSAAFIALGMAQQLKEPVGVVCTSGTAMLNYYPAVAEAYYQCIPLVVLSADRPEEWINHGDGQTIVQEGVYQNHIRAELNVPEKVSPQDVVFFDEEIAKAFQKCNGSWKGPVHFNFHLSEPLYETVEAERLQISGANEYQVPELDTATKSALTDAWNNSERRMILCGQLEPNPGVLNALIELADDASVAILVENTSNVSHPKFIHCIDRTLSAISEEEIELFQPDLLVTIGGAIVSKRIKSFLRKSPIEQHWKVGAAFPEMDTYRHLTQAVTVSETSFIRTLSALNDTKHVSQFGWKWKQKDFKIQDILPQYIENARYSDLTVFDIVLDSIPENAYLHMANSSVVRYCQLFDPIRSIRYFSNRGTSGIDGSSSTAVGASIARANDLHVLITGDLSFFYDSNAFWNNYVGENLKVVVVNNSGGGIFRIINGPNKVKGLYHYLETENKAKVSGICEAFNMVYLKAENLVEVEQQMATLLTEPTGGRPAVLEIFTPNTENSEVLDGFFKHFKSL